LRVESDAEPVHSFHLVDKTGAGADCGLSSVLSKKVFQDVADMGLHCADSDVKPARDRCTHPLSVATSTPSSQRLSNDERILLDGSNQNHLQPVVVTFNCKMMQE